MSRLVRTFADLRRRGARALIPYFAAGGPSLAAPRRRAPAPRGRARADPVLRGRRSVARGDAAARPRGGAARGRRRRARRALLGPAGRRPPDPARPAAPPGARRPPGARGST